MGWQPGPAVLQRICDALQPGTIAVFFQRWLSRLPLPLGAATSAPDSGGAQLTESTMSALVDPDDVCRTRTPNTP